MRTGNSHWSLLFSILKDKANFLSNVADPETPKVVRNVGYGLSDTRWKVVGLGRSEHMERVVRMTLAKADTSTFKCR